MDSKQEVLSRIIDASRRSREKWRFVVDPVKSSEGFDVEIGDRDNPSQSRATGRLICVLLLFVFSITK